MKSILFKISKRIFPSVYWKIQKRRLQKNFVEQEMCLLPILCDDKRTSLDIGASNGVYAVNLIPYSKDVIAFEPVPKKVNELKTMFKYIKSNLRVESVALSDKAGQEILRMIKNESGRSTIEAENKLEDCLDNTRTAITINTKRLDDYQLNNVGFIKIDVEGHELAVLEGAQKTIKLNLPSFLIESEERHKKNSIELIKKFFEPYGYKGFFLLDKEIKDLNEFSVTTYQNKINIGDYANNYRRSDVYVNNFIFIQRDNADDFIKSAKRILASQ